MTWQNRITRYSDEPPDQLLANPRNWRSHPGSQADALRGVLQDVGVVQNVLANERTGYLIDGHLRVMEALKSGQPTVPVTWVDLSEEEEALILATLDPLSALAGTDAAQLDALLREVSTDSPALQQMLDEIAQAAGIVPGIEEGDGGDDFDTTPDEGPTRSQLGDLWLIGGVHRLLVGDCTDAGNVARLMGGERADAVVSDPPYGMRLDADFSGMRNHLDFASQKGIKNGRKYDNVTGDHEDYNAAPLRKLFAEVKEQFWFGADYYSATLGDTMHEGAWLVWDKRLEENADRMYGSCFELLWSQQKHKRDMLRHKWAGIFGTEHEPQRGREHPNQKPVRLLEDVIERYTEANDLVFDGYLGSGTTLIAAHRTGRRCYGCEIEPRYADVILRRAEAEGLATELIPPMVKE